MMSIFDEDTMLAVKKGAAWLDEVVPGWIERIDLSILSVANPFCCVLGQVFGEYGQAPFPVRNDNPPSIDSRRGYYGVEQDWSSEHGFWEPGGDWDPLDSAWKYYIGERS